MNLGHGKCDVCGKYSQIVDEYTHFGQYGDTEPPEPIGLCRKCSREIEDGIADIQRPSVPYLPWRPGQCHYRGMRRAGLVLCTRGGGAPIAAWPDRIPEGYEIVEGVV